MNEITAAIKKKTEEKYPIHPIYADVLDSLTWETYINHARLYYTCGGEDAIGFMLKFVEWMGEEENSFVMVKGRWFQACGNSTSWTTEQLLLKYIDSIK